MTRSIPWKRSLPELVASDFKTYDSSSQSPFSKPGLQKRRLDKIFVTLSPISFTVVANNRVQSKSYLLLLASVNEAKWADSSAHSHSFEYLPTSHFPLPTSLLHILHSPLSPLLSSIHPFRNCYSSLSLHRTPSSHRDCLSSRLKHPT